MYQCVYIIYIYVYDIIPENGQVLEVYVLLIRLATIQIATRSLPQPLTTTGRFVSGIILDHLGFYYNRYYSKPLTAKSYGVENEQELIALAKDCVFVNKDKVRCGGLNGLWIMVSSNIARYGWKIRHGSGFSH